MLNTRKKVVSFLLSCALLVGMLIPSASAASTTRKGYTISSGNTTVYSDTAMTKKLGTIYGTDEITVIDVTSSYAKLTYPLDKGGTKTGYVPTSAILTKTTGTNKTATAQITTYRRNSTSNTYGYVSRGDIVLVLGTKGDFTQIKYPVGVNGYKYAFIKTSDANKYLSSGTPSSTTKLSYGLYKSTSARISCNFDGYTNTKGRHEGIDITLYNGAPVYALVSGTVVRVAKGSNGSSGLSTIAIYDSSADKTVIYLHTNPLSLTEGQSITKGQQIATQGWRGISSASGGHTHVEVRNGKQGYAAKSVNDYTLDNPNPSTYLASKGYIIQ